MAKLRVKGPTPVMTVRRSRYWTKKMVYVVLADRPIKYHSGRSRVIYIGTTKRGEGRPASNAASKSMKAFERRDRFRGVRSTEVCILTCQKKQNVQTWELLECALLVVFKYLHGQLPEFNYKLEKLRRIEDVDEYFREKRLRAILRGFE